MPDNACMNPLAISLSKYNGNREKTSFSNAALRFIRILRLFLRCSSFCIILLACVAAAFSFSTLAPMLFSPDEGREGKESFLFSFPPPPHLLVRLNQQSGSTLFHSGSVIFVVTSVLPIPEGTENSEYIFFVPIAPEHPLSCANFGITLHGRHVETTTKSHKVFKYTGRC